MKAILLFTLLVTQNLFAKTIVISGFDAFDGNKGNNSQVIGKALEKRFNNKQINVKYCQLRTVYFKSSEQLKDCINSLDEQPDYIIALGEAHCNGLHFETKAKNWMKDISQDNDGVHFEGEPIRPDQKESVKMSLELRPLYKMLSRSDRRFVKISKDQGTFVCNNLSYIMESDLEDIKYTFIHVPRNNCKKSDKLVSRSIDVLTKTIENLFK